MQSLELEEPVAPRAVEGRGRTATVRVGARRERALDALHSAADVLQSGVKALGENASRLEVWKFLAAALGARQAFLTHQELCSASGHDAVLRLFDALVRSANAADGGPETTAVLRDAAHRTRMALLAHAGD